MTLSRREQILLAVLAIFAILAFGFYVVYQPLQKRHDALSNQLMEQQTQLDQVTAEIAQLANRTVEATELSKQIDSKTVRYFPSIIQEQLILMMNQIYSGSQIQVNNQSFVIGLDQSAIPQPVQVAAGESAAPDLKTISNNYKSLMSGAAAPTAEPAAGQQAASTEEINAQNAALSSIESMGLNVQFTANYTQTIEFIRQVEALNRSILVKNLVMSTSKALNQTTIGPDGQPVAVTTPTGLLDCTFDLVFNAVPKLTAQDDAYEAWTLTGTYGKADPFIK